METPDLLGARDQGMHQPKDPRNGRVEREVHFSSSYNCSAIELGLNRQSLQTITKSLRISSRATHDDWPCVKALISPSSCLISSPFSCFVSKLSNLIQEM